MPSMSNAHTRRAWAPAWAAIVLLATAGSATAETARKPVLPFRADGYEATLAAAKERDLPLFVENWAPW